MGDDAPAGSATPVVGASSLERRGTRDSLRRVQVLDRETREPVAACRVLSQGEELLAHSDDEGWLRFETLPEVRVVVRHAQYEEWTGDAGVLAGMEFLLLDPLSFVQGQILLPVGAEGESEGVVVLAWRGPRPRAEALRAARLGEAPDGVHVTPCAADGTFAFRDLVGKREWHLVAAGAGLASLPRSGIDARPGEPVEVPLCWLHGVQVRTVDGEGDPLAISEAWCSPSGWSTRASTGPPPSPFATSDPQVVLNGIDLPAPQTLERSERTFLLGSPVPLASGDRPVLVGHFPGYADVEVPLDLRPVTAGLNVQEVALISRVPERGDLEVHLDPAVREAFESGPGTVRLAVLEFAFDRSDLGIQQRPGPLPEVLSVPDLPAGPFRAWLQLPDGVRLPLEDEQGSTDLELHPEGTVAHARLGELAHLEVTVVRGGAPYTGPLTLDVGRMRSDGMRASREFSFAASPYRLPLARPGRYAGAATRPFVADLTTEAGYEFEVEPGSTVRLELVVE